ncbi:Mitochondrial matrix iron chaperone [Polyrhizophydium stewartii]|uniref:ferroxidase n=1 Tax=Polyrhizophydium stewartii TaxID=2732419 RepID=A0ABR4N2Z7_9FUNG|nr:Mitochondrial chaperone Frataxin [Polyrhizophydium stewartii]
MSTAPPADRLPDPALSDADYHKHADAFIESLLEFLEELGDVTDVDGYDVVYSSGVLTLKLGEHGTYVVNKQPPNKQLWLSSPVSGPKRYDVRLSDCRWIYSRDGHSLDELLNTELSQMLGDKIAWKPPGLA